MTKEPYIQSEIEELGTVAELTQGGGYPGELDGVVYSFAGIDIPGLSGGLITNRR